MPYDPGMSIPTDDFESQIEQAKRNRALIDYLRKQNPEDVSRGRMVGKFYVPNSRMSILAPALQNITGTIMAGRQDAADAQRQIAMRQAAEQWMSSLPKARTMVQDPMGPPTEEGIPPAQVSLNPPTQTIQPSQSDKLAWAMQGQRNPLTQALAAHYAQDALINEPIREEARAEKKQARLDTITAHHEDVQAQIGMRRDALQEQARQADARLAESIRQNIGVEQARIEANAIRQQLADLAQQALDYKKQHDKDVADAKKDAPAQKPLSLTDLTKLQTAAIHVEAANRYVTTFDDKFSGPLGEAKRMSGALNPFADKTSKASAEWWNDYQSHKNDVRHTLFGSALTSTEKGEWEKSDITTSMQPDQIRKNLARRAFLEKKAYDKLEAAAGASTRAGQLEAIRPNLSTQPPTPTVPTKPAAAGGLPAGWSMTVEQ